MKKLLKILTIALLLFNSIGAMYGGIGLMAAPDGSIVQLDPALLASSPFSDYFIPGLILLLANGVFSLLATYMLIRNHRRAYLFVIAQGAILCGWLVIQILMIDLFYFLHYVMGATGLVLLLLGILLRIYYSNQSVGQKATAV